MNQIDINSDNLSWNDLSSVLVDCDKSIKWMNFKYIDELTTVDYLNRSSYANDTIDKWLMQRNEMHPGRSDLAKKYIDEGNAIYNETDEPHDLAADFYTKAIFSAPESSDEFRIALEKRSSCIVESEKSPEESPEAYRPIRKLNEKYEASVGRFIVAEEAIKEGELIMEENAFAFVPVYNGNNLDPIFYHCQNCARTNCQPLPCQKCLRASYCSEKCLDHHRTIHQIECTGYMKNLWVDIGIAHLAFRTFIVGFHESLEKFDGMKENLRPHQILANLTELNENFVYGDVLRLVTNFNEMNSRDLFLYGLTAQMLVIYLNEYTTFFKTLPEICLKLMPNVEDWKHYARAMLMRHMGHLIMNAHTMSSIDLVPASLYGKGYLDDGGNIGARDFHLVTEISLTFSAIYPKTSILNHSCDENARNFFIGRTLRMFAQHDIQPNSEVCNSYGPNYLSMSKEERQSALMERYYFKCKCEKCQTNNDEYERMHDYICPSCKSTIRIDTVDPYWWNNLDDATFTAQIMPKFSCNKCKETLKLNPKTLTKYFDDVQTIKDVNAVLAHRRKLLEDVSFYFLEIVTCLPTGHELRTTMAEALLSFDMFDIGFKQKHSMHLALIAMDYCKNIKERFGVHSLEYVKSITYAIHTLALIDSDQKEFRKMIENSLQLNNVFECTKILPQSMRTLFKYQLVKVLSTEE